MYLTKKAKILISCGVPAAVLSVTTLVAWPIVATRDKEINHVLSNPNLNYFPQIVSKEKIDLMLRNGLILFNPENFSTEFFVKNIANQPLDKNFLAEVNDLEWQKITNKTKSEVKNTNDLLFEFSSTNKNIQYSVNQAFFEYQPNDDVSQVKESTKADFQVKLKATVEKKYQNRITKYNHDIDVNETSFIAPDDTDKENRNFLKYAVYEFKNLVRDNHIKVNASNVDSTNIATYSDKIFLTSGDLDLNVVPNGDKKYNIDYKTTERPLGIFQIAEGQENQIEFSFADASDQVNLWNIEQAWPKNENGEFDQNKSEAYKKLDDLRQDLFLDGNNAKLENYLFNPDYDPFTFGKVNGKQQKIPKGDNAAILVKLRLKDQVTYCVIWQNLIQSSFDQILDNAPEMAFSIPEDLKPSAQDVKTHPETYLKINTSQSVNQGLEYRIAKDASGNYLVDVKEDENGNYTVDVQIKITLVDDPTKGYYRIYLQTGITGVKSKAQAEFDTKLDTIVGADGNLSNLTPTVTITDATLKGKDLSETTFLLDQALKNGDLDSKIIISNSNSNVENLVKYIPQSVTSSNDKVLIIFQVTKNDNEGIIYSTHPIVMATFDPLT